MNCGSGNSSLKPKLVAVGGGKGGVGKSIVSILVAHWLARFDQRTVVVDLDLSGANVHTLLGITDVPVSINDFLKRSVDSFDQVALRTSLQNLRVICGASENLAVANLVFAQKVKLMRALNSIDADYVVMDLGAGTSFNVLDFFLMADEQLVVTTAEPVAIFNAYTMLRNAVYRRLGQLTRKIRTLQRLTQLAADPENPMNLKTITDFFQTISELGGSHLLGPFRRELARIRPKVVVNQVQDEKDLNAARIVETVAEKYLSLQVESIGGIVFDRQLRKMVAAMEPLTLVREGGAFESAYELSASLLREPDSQKIGPDTQRIPMSAPENATWPSDFRPRL